MIPKESLKECTSCNSIYPATYEYFYKQKKYKKIGEIKTEYKLSSQCKVCYKSRARSWQTNNREKHNEIQKKYFQTDKGRSTRNPENDKE